MQLPKYIPHYFTARVPLFSGFVRGLLLVTTEIGVIYHLQVIDFSLIARL